MEVMIRIARLIMVGLILTIFVWVFLVSLNLRPIADDYCHGAVATSGFLGATSTWLLTWTGAFFPAVIGVVFVGLPLAFLPIGISSAVGYLISALSVGMMVVLAFQPRWKDHFFRNVAMVIVLTTLWLLHLRIVQILGTRPGEVPDGLLTYQLAEMLTHWQTVTVGYVLTPVIAITVTGYGLLGSFSRKWVRLSIVFVGTFLAGQAGYVLGATLSVFFALLVFFDWALGMKRSWQSWIVGVLGAFVGLAATLLFPGAYARAGATESGTFDRFPTAIRAMPHGISQWFEELVSLTSVVVILSGGLFFLLFSAALKPIPAETWTGFVPRSLLAGSAVFYVVKEAAAALVYSGEWHIIPARLMTFVALIFLGIGLARFVGRAISSRLHDPRHRAATLFLFFILVSWLLVVAGAVLTSSILNRAEVWDQGPAPLQFIDDREAPWVGECWSDLENHSTGSF